MGDRRLFRGRSGAQPENPSVDDASTEEVSPSAIDAADEADEFCARTPLTVEGVISEVSLGSRGDAPALEATLDAINAETGEAEHLVLVWMGRADIAGIHPGREIVATARVCAESGARVMYNPRYDLR